MLHFLFPCFLGLVGVLPVDKDFDLLGLFGIRRLLCDLHMSLRSPLTCH